MDNKIKIDDELYERNVKEYDSLTDVQRVMIDANSIDDIRSVVDFDNLSELEGSLPYEVIDILKDMSVYFDEYDVKGEVLNVVDAARRDIIDGKEVDFGSFTPLAEAAYSDKYVYDAIADRYDRLSEDFFKNLANIKLSMASAGFAVNEYEKHSIQYPGYTDMEIVDYDEYDRVNELLDEFDF